MFYNYTSVFCNYFKLILLNMYIQYIITLLLINFSKLFTNLNISLALAAYTFNTMINYMLQLNTIA